MSEQIRRVDFFMSSRIGRKLLQQNSSFDASQGAFIGLITVIAVLTVVIVVMLIVLCCRFCSRRKSVEKKSSSKRPKKFQPILSYPANLPTSITPSSTSPHTVRSSDRLVSPTNHQQTSTVSTNPSRRVQSSMMDAYLHDLNPLNPRQLNSFLFVDLHSTSSETFPSNTARAANHHHNPNNTTTSGYHTSIGDENPLRPPMRSWRRTTGQQAKSTSRFVVRERSLPIHLQNLPQLRQTTLSQHIRDPNESSFNSNNPDVLSTDVSMTTNDYDDSHAYHVHQHQLMQTIKEEQNPADHQLFFEVVSTSRGDDSDLIRTSHAPAFINESIIV